MFIISHSTGCFECEQYTVYFSGWMHFTDLCTQKMKCLVKKYAMWDTPIYFLFIIFFFFLSRMFHKSLCGMVSQNAMSRSSVGYGHFMLVILKRCIMGVWPLTLTAGEWVCHHMVLPEWFWGCVCVCVWWALSLSLFFFYTQTDTASSTL